MTVFKKSVFIFCLMAALAVGWGCENEGPAEKAGKRIDHAVEEAGDGIEEAADKLEESVDN